MTTIHTLSDIHLEFVGEGAFSKRLRKDYYKNTTGADILVLAGDVTPNIRQYRRFLAVVAQEYDEVVAVAGNHEFYGHNFYSQMVDLKELFDERSNTHFLDNEFIELKGVRFFGAHAGRI